MTDQPKSILSFGFMQFVDSRPVLGISSHELLAVVEAEQEKASKAGYNIETFGVNPNDVSSLEAARKVLKSKYWDGISIGFGVRGQKEYSEVFEKLVNICLEEVKPAPKMLFPVGPNQLFLAVQRVFPDSQ
jgi:hypothetical protein